jgi:hypothetical protein
VITFSFPYTSPTTTVTLRSPQQRDAELHDIKTLFRRAMAGNVKTHKRTPVGFRLTLEFIEILKSDLDAFRDFLAASAGQEVRYTDYDNVAWRCRVLTEPLVATAVARDYAWGGSECEATERYSFAVQLEGSHA